MFKLNQVCGALALMNMVGFAAVARAQNATTAPTVEATTQSITVTARKREERGLDVPASLNVFGNDDLQRMGITDLTQLQLVTPGLSVSGYGARVSIRGVGNNVPGVGADPSSAVNFDGVYIPRQQLALFNIYDVNRVEVLKGPQGTLYGRNATGGVINIVTQDPRAGTGAEGYLGVGSFGLRSAQVIGNFGDEKAGLRVGVDYGKDDGYTKNLTPGAGPVDAVDYVALRLKGVFSPTSNIKVKLTAQGLQDNGTTGMGFSNNPLTDNYASAFPEGYRQDERHIRTDGATRRKQDGFIGAANIEADFGSLTLRSITGVVDYRFKEVLDTDGSGVFIEIADSTVDSRMYSQEFQLLGSTDKVDWTLGLYASREKAEDSSLLTDQDYPTPPPYEFTYRGSSVVGRSAAIFGAMTYRITPQINATLGGRYTSERKNGTAAGRTFGTPWQGQATVDDKAFTPKVELEYKPVRDALYYASVGKGFKSGGLNVADPVATYEPENIVAYEIGTKQILWAGKLDFSAAVFHYDYKNLQLRAIEFSPGPTSVVTNVAKAPINGAELTAALRLTREFSMDLALAWLDAPVQNFKRRADRPVLNTDLPLSPKNTVNLGLDYKVGVASGVLSSRVEYNRQSGVIFPALADPTIEKRDAVGLVNANLRYTLAGGKTYVSVIGRNLTNKTYLADRFFYNGFADLETYAPPRQLQLRVGTSF